MILGIRCILWPQNTPPDGQTVRRLLFSFLNRRRREAPQRGRGAYLRRFVEHAIEVTKRHALGLFHCYDDPRIPQTTNTLEGVNGDGKRNLRRCGGRSSTANGPGTSCGRAYMTAVTLNACLSAAEIEAMLALVKTEDYRNERRLLDQVRAPSSRRRAMLRNPSRYLSGVLERWKGP